MIVEDKDNVKHLATLSMTRPECNFIAMHIAYPYQNELIAAIKNIRNLYAEMSWVWIIDPEPASIFLKEALCATPLFKRS